MPCRTDAQEEQISTDDLFLERHVGTHQGSMTALLRTGIGSQSILTGEEKANGTPKPGVRQSSAGKRDEMAEVDHSGGADVGRHLTHMNDDWKTNPDGSIPSANFWTSRPSRAASFFDSAPGMPLSPCLLTPSQTVSKVRAQSTNEFKGDSREGVGHEGEDAGLSETYSS